MMKCWWKTFYASAHCMHRPNLFPLEFYSTLFQSNISHNHNHNHNHVLINYILSEHIGKTWQWYIDLGCFEHLACNMVKAWLCSIPRNTCIACSYLLLLWLPSQPFFLQIFSSEVVWLKRLGRPWSWELVLSHLSFCFQLSCKTNIKVLLIGNVNDKSWPWVWFRIFISVVSFYNSGCTYNWHQALTGSLFWLLRQGREFLCYKYNLIYLTI